MYGSSLDDSVRVLEFSSLLSTMGKALELLECSPSNDVECHRDKAHIPEGTVVWAHAQTAGRGRRGREWMSHADKGLWFTLILRPDVFSLEKNLGQLSLVCGWAVLQHVADLALKNHHAPPRTEPSADRADGLSIKWPNDILYNGRKLAGLLLEYHQGVVLCGVGINVYEDDAMSIELRDASAYLGEAVDCVARIPLVTHASVAGFSSAILNHYRRWQHEGFEFLRSVWKSHDALAHREVSFYNNHGVLMHARATGIAADGGLMVVDDEGMKRTVYAGEVSLVRSCSNR